jgi:hypothetical protein
MMAVVRPLWTCPTCGRTFANRNQTHACAALGSVDDHFAGTDPVVRACFERILAVVSRLGPVDVLAERTRVALHARMSFAAFTPRPHWLDGHLVLARSAQHPAVRRVQAFSPRNVLHAFRLSTPDDVDPAFEGLLAEAYEVGRQFHRRR